MTRMMKRNPPGKGCRKSYKQPNPEKRHATKQMSSLVSLVLNVSVTLYFVVNVLRRRSSIPFFTAT